MPHSSSLLGTWKMISLQREIVRTGERLDSRLGAHPVGYLSYGADGRVCAFAVGMDRPAPAGTVPTTEDKARLFDSMLAYVGTYTQHEDRVIHHIDASWNQTWTGTDAVRFYSLQGETLTIRTAPFRDPQTEEEV